MEIIHEAGFLHLDIKPENILVSKDKNEEFENICLVDFGLRGKYIDDNGNIIPPKYEPGYRGTVPYMSVNAHKYGRNGLGNKINYSN